ncbi:MISP family member 3 [Chelydra serpentina]|uniref:MISP family member 3 n=1 Tax=Chelydra serpentina TaxID=8475 RepID=A0A8T1SP80_CHESE|nr:MISP family member 3 [Chelydra serpentina]
MENGDPSSDGETSPAAPPEALKPGGETPIEREIRLHQEREETLRRQRGLAGPRGTQEYVEVRMKPILSQAQQPAQLPKEKERQWAGAQMQREIQRERLREEDLMQLGKVRGAYDRGTPRELQEKKMLFEQQPSPEPPSPRKPARVPCSSSAKNPPGQGPRGPSFAEANGRASVVILEPSTLLRQGPGRQAPLERSPSAQGNPFFRLRSRSPQSRLELEVQEVQKREQELQKQRHYLYGWAPPWGAQGAAEGEEPHPSRPERPSCGKLDVTWPPPALSESPQENGLDQVEKSPRSLRQRSGLIQHWESGAISNQESQE